MSVQTNHGTVKFHQAWRMAGRSFCVETGDALSARLVQWLLAGYQATPVDHLSGRPDYRLRVRRGRLVSLPPDIRLRQETADWRCLTNGRSVWYELDDSLVIAHADPAAGIEVLLSEHLRGRHQEALGRIFGCALQLAMQRCGLYFLHAAGIVAPESGSGALLIGASGSGKSTLTMRLAASGWQYLSDDLLLLDDRPQQVTAYGLRRRFAITAQTLTAFDLPQMAALPESNPPHPLPKHWLEPEQVFSGKRVEACVPRALLFPRLTGQPLSRVERMTPREALLELLNGAPLASLEARTARAWFSALARLTRQATAWRLLAGSDLLTDPARAADLITETLNRSSA